MTFPLQRTIFDYDDGALALRAAAAMQNDADARRIFRDALWRSTRERGLFLAYRLCCVLDAERVVSLLRALDAAMQGNADFVSTGTTPDRKVTECIDALLGAIGFDPVEGSDVASDVAAVLAPWAYHDVVADMRASRLTGTGQGGQTLTPGEDGVRRVKTILIAAGLLSPGQDGDRAIAISADFGRAELAALTDYIDRCLDEA